jgi:MFS family permease
MNQPQDRQDGGALFDDRNFRWLLAGAIVSMLGDQFTLIALPWLVLKMTGDTLVLGTVLAVMSVPRAMFILLGGALVDRHSPQRVLMLSKYVNTLLLATLAALVLTDHLLLWAIYALALAIGLASAFSLPSGNAMVAHVVAREHIARASSMMMALRQLSMFAGPLLAGLLIAAFGSDAAGAVRDARGIGVAFLFDAFSFALSAWTLSRVRMPVRAGDARAADTGSVWKAIGAGLQYCWQNRSLRVCFGYWAAVAFFISGPIQVALPVLADHVGRDAAAFGMLAGAYGIGTLFGMVASGARPQFRVGTLGTTMLSFDAVIGLLFIPLGLIGAVWHGVALLAVIGLLSGFLQVTVYSWLQRQVAPAMLGRTMGLFMFIFMGIAPMSAALTGWIMRSVPIAQLFIVSGALLVVIAGLTFALSAMRSVSDADMERNAEGSAAP